MSASLQILLMVSLPAANKVVLVSQQNSANFDCIILNKFQVFACLSDLKAIPEYLFIYLFIDGLKKDRSKKE